MIKSFVSKWIMRVKEARTVLTLGLWSIMATTQVLDFVRPYLVAWQMVTVACLMGIGGLAFTYGYDKLGFMLGENRERAKRKNILNHMGMMHFLSQAIDADKDEMMEEYSEFLQDYGRGVNINEIR